MDGQIHCNIIVRQPTCVQLEANTALNSYPVVIHIVLTLRLVQVGLRVARVADAF